MKTNDKKQQRPDLLAMPHHVRRDIIPEPQETLIKDGRKKPNRKKSELGDSLFGGGMPGLSNTV